VKYRSSLQIKGWSDKITSMVYPSRKKNKGLRRLFLALINSFSGFGFALKEESSFRQELFLSLILIPVAWFSPSDLFEKLLMISSVIILLIVELVNSSIETTIDRISLSHHNLSKRAKDLGSAAVFLSIILVIVVYATILLQYI